MFNQTTLLLPPHEPTTTEPIQTVVCPSKEVTEYGYPVTIEITTNVDDPRTLQIEFNGTTKALYSLGGGSPWFYWDGVRLIPIEGDDLDYPDMVDECLNS